MVHKLSFLLAVVFVIALLVSPASAYAEEEADVFSIYCIGDSLTFGVIPGTAGKRWKPPATLPTKYGTPAGLC